MRRILCVYVLLLSFNAYADSYMLVEAGASFVNGGQNKNDPNISLWEKGPTLQYGNKLGVAGRIAFGHRFSSNHALEFGLSHGQTIKTQAQGEVHNMDGRDIYVNDPYTHQPAHINVLNYSYSYEYKLNYRADLSYLYTFTEGVPNLYLKTGVSLGIGEFNNRSLIKYVAPGMSGERSDAHQGEQGWNMGLVLGAGYSWPMEKNLDLRVGYALNMDFLFGGPGNAQYQPQVMNQSVTAGIVYKF